MKLMKPVLWTTFGVMLGLAARFLPSPVQAQSTPAEQPEQRLVVTPVASPRWLRMYIVHDPKTNGCWLASHAVDANAFASMAVAPLTMCLNQ